MILLVQNRPDYENDFRAMLQAFYPAVRIETAGTEPVSGKKNDSSEAALIFTAFFSGQGVKLSLRQGEIVTESDCPGDFRNRGDFRNCLKQTAYRILEKSTGRSLPWGSLTGMRPTKIATKAFREGRTRQEVISLYQEKYDCSREKAALAADVALTEAPTLRQADPGAEYMLYVHIPFCPTRCLYCSFAAFPVTVYADRIPVYLDALEKELREIAGLNQNRKLKCIYVGGGTPTALSGQQLDSLLCRIGEAFDIPEGTEYTVEAGRPDSITPEKLQCMKAHGVNRISINPQTMNGRTLEVIGRAHSPEEIKRAFYDARQAGFNNINMDIIAGLPGEKLGDMQNTLDQLEKLGPDALTVHALALKRTARLREELDQYRTEIGNDADGMMQAAEDRAGQWGMRPYYLYRQRNIAGNLENTGFCRPGTECFYNILEMEERLDTFGAGAGAVTRLQIYDTERRLLLRTVRVENVRNVDTYIDRIDEMTERIRTAVEKRDSKVKSEESL